MRSYKVATYWHPELRGLNRASCYLRDYNSAWKGYVPFVVMAKSGREAKRIAARARAVLEGAARWIVDDEGRREFVWNEGAGQQ